MREESFKFSQDKRFAKVTFKEFVDIVHTLSEIISRHGSTPKITVLSAEDIRTYNYTTATMWSDVIEKGLEQRKQYSVDELTSEVWERSYKVQVIFKDGRNRKPFMICVTCDTHADPKCVLFYGRALDAAMRESIIHEFFRATLWHRIGDATGGISTFNAASGPRLTGIRPAR